MNNEKLIAGKISFIHHEKDRAVIEYEENGKKKTIQATIDEEAQAKLIEQKIIKKPHRFLVGDHVKFLIKKTGSNGRILYAGNVQYQFNTTLEILINKAAFENKFLGYIKITDSDYFIKEIDSYLFFPLKISVYEIKPSAKELEKPVTFKLENLDKPDKIVASLYNHHYISEFYTAVQHFKKQLPVEAVVYKSTPYKIYLQLFNGKIEAGLAIPKHATGRLVPENGVKIMVMIKYLSPEKIVVENI